MKIHLSIMKPTHPQSLRACSQAKQSIRDYFFRLLHPPVGGFAMTTI